MESFKHFLCSPRILGEGNDPVWLAHIFQRGLVQPLGFGCLRWLHCSWCSFQDSFRGGMFFFAQRLLNTYALCCCFLDGEESWDFKLKHLCCWRNILGSSSLSSNFINFLGYPTTLGVHMTQKELKYGMYSFVLFTAIRHDNPCPRTKPNRLGYTCCTLRSTVKRQAASVQPCIRHIGHLRLSHAFFVRWGFPILWTPELRPYLTHISGSQIITG